MKKYILIAVFVVIAQGCGFYNFTGGNVGSAETFQVNRFENNSPIIEPGLDRDFRLALQDLITNQTNLSYATSGGDLLYEGEITEYRIAPMSATSQNTAAQNRLTISVNVRFYNATKPDDDFEQRFSFFYDFPAATSVNAIKSEAHEVIFERITQDIFNESLANW